MCTSTPPAKMLPNSRSESDSGRLSSVRMCSGFGIAELLEVAANAERLDRVELAQHEHDDRHAAVMFRLLFGDLNPLTLPKNGVVPIQFAARMNRNAVITTRRERRPFGPAVWSMIPSQPLDDRPR